MSLRHGLLGLLAEGPASGYDLARRFTEALGLVWPARHPQIYTELSRLETAALIEVDSHGPRGRKAYRITDAGRAEVRRWLTQVEVDHTFRMETLFRSYFFWLMEPDEVRAHLAEEERFYAEMARRLRGYAEAKDRGEWGTGGQARAMRIALEAGIRVNEALADWARWGRDADLMTAEDFGTAETTDDAPEQAKRPRDDDS
ncbi:PadR family transcriptional regulator [Actinomadura pelletieri DSM 43383]|uniref:PadR family transcriptional regulator n=1 Tax=Actinomadura pelletieri DSM 43383 TaxID=1120940 RepID=A0A495QZZ8_9ACTN|nr:PadR family transcriptional regulator [Actinomadura pelletieri]RKS79805.1 PadR family transcriptional regulator [Actinomadura pelletieri DSM 43383]